MFTIIVAIYAISLMFLFVYSIGQFHLTWHYLKNIKSSKNQAHIQVDTNSQNKLPKVTIQLPLYNELYVTERLIQSVANIEYPRDLLQIQILDDSTDETTNIIENIIKKLPDNLQIEHIRRADRTGYKAGALRYATETASGELIAIFDADFVPDPQFLLKTVPHFSDKKIGLVQTKWGHLNKDYSLLTHCQAFGLDAHFTVEQAGKNAAGCFISFNGTAGIWRKECISNAGGWQADTLTEDLDLSYRAQLKGWKFVYLEDLVSPAELPLTVGALKSQQFRWNKGAAETHVKVWRDVWKAKLNKTIKIQALLQLFKGIGFVASFVLTIISVPIIWVKSSSTEYLLAIQVLGFTFICVLILSLFYYASLIKSIEQPIKRLKYFIVNFPLFMAVSFGISLHNSIAVIEGYIGKKTPFIRTPKFNIEQTGNYNNNVYKLSNLSLITWLEGLLALYFAFGIGYGIYSHDYSFIPFHFLLLVGYSIIFGYSIIQQFKY